MFGDLYLLTVYLGAVVLHDGPHCGLSHDRRTAFVSADALLDERRLRGVTRRLGDMLTEVSA